MVIVRRGHGHRRKEVIVIVIVIVISLYSHSIIAHFQFLSRNPSAVILFCIHAKHGYFVVMSGHPHGKSPQQRTNKLAKSIFIFRKQIRMKSRYLLHVPQRQSIHHRTETMRMYPVESLRIYSFPERNPSCLTSKLHRILPLIKVEHHTLMPVSRHLFHQIPYHDYRPQWP